MQKSENCQNWNPSVWLTYQGRLRLFQRKDNADWVVTQCDDGTRRDCLKRLGGCEEFGPVPRGIDGR